MRKPRSQTTPKRGQNVKAKPPRTPVSTTLAAAALVVALVCVATYTTLSLSTTATTPSKPATPGNIHLRLLRVFPHDRTAFTQGLVYLEDENILLESTGMYGDSDLRSVNATTGEVLSSHKLDARLFGEGLTHIPSERMLYQLTWRENQILVYTYEHKDNTIAFHPATVLNKGQFPATLNGQLWGICNNKTHLFISDGTHDLTIWRRDSGGGLTRTARHAVHRREGKRKKNIQHINELECMPNGDVLANVWYSHNILRIDPNSGAVLQVLDMKDIAAPQGENVLNGIAFDSARSELYLTGKNWDKMYTYALTRGE